MRAIKQGAIDFIEKPVDGQYLLDRVCEAIDRDARNRREYAERAAIIARVESLTPREREVLAMVVAGTANKNIAATLGRSQKTVEIHRANMMKKMGAASLAQLVSFVHIAGLANGNIALQPSGTKSVCTGPGTQGAGAGGNGSGSKADAHDGRRLLTSASYA